MILEPQVWAAAPADSSGNWATDLMESLGSPGVAIATGLESLFPTVPSELVLLLGGYTARLGDLNFLALVCWSTIGSVVGSVLHYYVGALLGRRRTRAIFIRFPLVQESDLDRAEGWFARYGAKAVLVGRLIPIVRSYVSLPAGIERMPTPLFTAYTAIGSLLWNLVLLTVGYAVGSSHDTVEQYANGFTAVVGGLLLVLVARFVFVRLRARRRERRETPAEPV